VSNPVIGTFLRDLAQATEVLTLRERRIGKKGNQ